ncbi:undecaprenyldiphospho-muramoylpentapeptide beta-N-acetylglucosaminyltransferase [candidate division KSB1 bacterium]|nr:undecaprenyldiphospho-muramoylpentapeptide beta-N-acetylglucosaminyltransferase [candidate division KSB1 bacterium]
MKTDAGKKLRIIVAGGGTGGHLYPGLALVEELKRRGNLADIIFAGTKRGIESRIIPKEGYRLKYIWIRGFQRSLNPANLIFPLRVIVSLLQAYRLVRHYKPDAVIGTGGYVSGPVLYVAAKLKIPTLIQEQNSYPGVTTRLLAQHASIVHLSFEESKKYFKETKNLVVTGNPIRAGFLITGKNSAYDKFHLTSRKKTLFVFGGSQGAHAINLAVLDILEPLMRDPGIQLLWGTGYNDYQTVKKQCKMYRERASVLPYIDNMPAAYAITDAAICRSGAMTMTELSLAGVPAIFIPLPHAAAGHQEFNARVLVDRGAAEMIREQDLKPEIFLDKIINLLKDDSRREKMTERMKEWANPAAAEEIIDSLLKLVK